MKALKHISITLLIIACNKAEDRACFKSAGKNDQLEMVFNSQINSFEFKDDIHIHLVEDSKSFIKLTGPKNLLQFVDIETDNNEVVISNQNKCDILRKDNIIKAEIHSPSFKSLKLRGYGKITNNDSLHHSITIDALNSFSEVDLSFKCHSISFNSQAGAILTRLRGTAIDFYVYNIGQAEFHSEQLETINLHFNNSGISNMYGNTNQYANIEIHNQGNVIITGNPINLIESGEGSGEIIITP